MTNLGTLFYDSNKSSVGYVSVLVAGESVDPKKATLVKMLILPNATDEGGSGFGEVKFFTRTNEFCIVAQSGVLK